jgi:hypothetical protein
VTMSPARAPRPDHPSVHRPDPCIFTVHLLQKGLR